MLALLRISLSLICAVALACGAAHAGLSTPTQLLTNAKNPIVWQEFHPWLMITEDLSNGRTCYWLDHNNKSRLNLKAPMPGTWAPLGSAIKWLMYVDHYQNLDRLMTHDVDWHFYYIAWTSAQNQVGAGMAGNKCIFGQYRPTPVGDHYPVDLYHFDVQTGACVPFCVSDSEKSQFAHDGSLIVYRANLGGGNVRIYGIRFSGGPEFEIAPRDGTQPSVCGNLVAWAEASGAGFNIVAKDLSTGDIRTVAYTTANPPRPQAGRGAIFWQDARTQAATGLDIYGYDWATAQEFVVTNAVGNQSGLRVCDDLVTWVSGVVNYQTLWGAYYQPPVKVNDLRAELVTSDSVRLAWTVPGSAQNPAVVYDLRARRDGPITDANWSTSTPVSGLPAPGAAGQTERFTVQPLTTGRCYFALKARLSSGEWSLLSNPADVWVSGQPDCIFADNGSAVSFSGVITGVGSDGALCCQDMPGPLAVRVKPRAGQPAVRAGQTATCTGVLSNEPGLLGPVLDSATVIPSGQSQARPLGMSNRALGGFSARFGGVAERGAPTLWTLVKTCGAVSGLAVSPDGCSFRVSDGSLGASAGVMVSSPFGPPAGLADGSFAVVEGVCRVSAAGERQIEVVTPSGVGVLPP